MHATIPLAGVGLLIGMMLLAGLGFTVAAWCFLCFRVGVWLAGGCTRRPVHLQAHRCAAPNPTPAPRAHWEERPKRRHDRPSSAVGLMLVLLLVCLAVFGLKSRAMHHALAARPVSDKAAVKISEDAKSPSWTVKGHGITKDDAEQIAMEAAYASVLNYVEQDMPAPHWTPSADYVARRLVTSKTTIEFHQAGLDPQTQQTTVQVELNAPAYRDILRRGRMLFLIKLVGALVLVLATIAVYLRLDDLGKGYYTGWLRLGTAAIVTAVIVGLLSLFGIFSGPVDPIAGSRWVEFSSLPVIPLAAIGLVVFLSLQLSSRKG
jgi:hypothetical protein